MIVDIKDLWSDAFLEKMDTSSVLNTMIHGFDQHKQGKLQIKKSIY